MRVIVILGRVLDPSGIVVKRKAARIFVNREEYILQPADRCALEAALRIKDAALARSETGQSAEGVEVVALPRGPLPDDDVLRQALSTGADQAVYLTGDGFERADDAVMAGVLAAAVERLGGADLILTGATTLDTGQGQLGPRLAEALGWPQIVDAWQVEAADGRVQAVIHSSSPPMGGDIHSSSPPVGGDSHSSSPPVGGDSHSSSPPVGGDSHSSSPPTGGDRGGGYTIVEADLPAVVTMLPGSLKLRYPDGVRLINIYKGVGEIAEALEQWDVTAPSTGLGAGPSTGLGAGLVDVEALKPLLERRGQDFPPERERGVRVSGTPEEMARAAADALRQRLGRRPATARRR